MVEKLEITILTDTSSWMNDYNKSLAEELKKLGHNVNLIYSQNKLEEGDLAFFLSCFELIGRDKLKLNKHNIVVHGSALPKGKGWSPMSWQILEGTNIIPLTLFEAVEKVDAGCIYLQDEIKLDGSELIKEWQNILGIKTIEMCLKFVTQYDKISGREQTGKETFYLRRTPKDSKLDINKTIKEQFNLLRIVDNEKYPAFFEINGQKYKLGIEKYE